MTIGDVKIRSCARKKVHHKPIRLEHHYVKLLCGSKFEAVVSLELFRETPQFVVEVLKVMEKSGIRSIVVQELAY